MKKRVKKKVINWKVLILSFVFVYFFAFIGSLLTSNSVKSNWYEIIKPSITPPSWVFPVVWNILFFLISISFYLSWMSSTKTHKKVLLIFGLNLFLNALWSFLFFFLKNPTFAFIEIFFLEASIVFMLLTTYKINKTSCYLLIPYLLWVAFAIFLNYLSI